MISFDFAYFKPDTLEEADQCYQHLMDQGKRVLYYGGGTEIISMARAESLRFDAVIDLKGIFQCNQLREEDVDLVIGSAVTLTAIAESEFFPLLGKTASRIADHTIQGKITLGGNLGGTILYKEAALPLMITNCRARVMGEDGLIELPFCEIFDGRLHLEPGRFLVQVLIDKKDTVLPYHHVKKTKADKIDYPLISLAAIQKNGSIRAAVSGAANTPMLIPQEILNDVSLSAEQRISGILDKMGHCIMDDLHGSKEYRMFVLGNTLLQLIENMEGA